MPGLPVELYNRCRDTLLKCSEFDGSASLRAVFVTDELYQFRNRLPGAESKSDRVDRCLDYLIEQQLSGGRPVLPIFLAALRDRYQPGDMLRDELGELVDQVQAAFISSASSTQTAQPSTSSRGPGGRPAAAPLEVATEIQHRYALLVGVRDYINPVYKPLPHTICDVVELSKVLRAAGYIVLSLHSDRPDQKFKPTRASIWDSLENMANQTGSGDLLLVYFGGHGDLMGDKAYLVPLDGGKSSLHRTAIDLDEFKETISNAGAQAKILILDACHSGIGRDAAGMGADFERHVYLEAAGTATLAACRLNQVAHEHHDSSHGVFTYYLLEGLRGAAIHAGQRFVTFNGLNDYVTHCVKQWAIERGLNQWPNANTQLVGDPPLLEPQRG